MTETRVYSGNKTPENWESYGHKRNTAVAIIREEKRSYYEKTIMENKSSLRALWNILNSLLPKHSRNTNYLQIEVNNEIISNPDEMANSLNNYYVSSIEAIVQTIVISGPAFPILPRHNEVFLEDFQLISLEQLRGIVFDMSNKNGSDEINIQFLKNCFNNLGLPLLNLINTSLLSASMPDALKISLGIPIPKVSDPIKAADLRPINMLSSIEKIREKVVFEQLTNFVENKRIFCI